MKSFRANTQYKNKPSLNFPPTTANNKAPLRVRADFANSLNKAGELFRLSMNNGLTFYNFDNNLSETEQGVRRQSNKKHDM